MQPFGLSLVEAADAIARRELSPVELTDSVLARIRAVEPVIGAFATVAADAARAEARRAADELAAGRYRGRLHGIPVAYKDLIDVAGLPTTASSRVPPGPVPTVDAVVAARLRAAGAVTIGKTHTHEFAAGVLTPTTRNPWAPDRVPGGSSGGSAAAVAARECAVALGTDTGGSIRIPAAFCGAVGLKPTGGLVPLDGVTPLSWSLDTVGPITRRVVDAATVLGVLTGDGIDYTCGLDAGVTGLRVGVLSPTSVGRLHAEIGVAVEGVVGALVELGARVSPFELPEAAATASTSWTLTFVEAATFHAENFAAHADRYGPDVRALLEVGQLIPGSRYVTALRARGVLQRLWREAFADLDVLLGPTVPCEPTVVGTPSVRWHDGSVEEAPEAFSRLTLGANVVGLPAISVPVGLTSAGLPIGVQLVARPFAEPILLRAAAACETVAGFDATAPREVVHR